MNDRFLMHQVMGSCFSWYSDADIRKLSVKKVTSPVAFDAMQHPILGGLYDPALGPTDKRGLCPTCLQTYDRCPGHMGHIDLIQPVYNPLLIVQLFKLLRCKCFACHRFKMKATRVRVYRVKLMLCDCGMVKEAMALEEELQACSGEVVEDPAEDAGRRHKILTNYETLCTELFRSGAFKIGGASAGMHAREYRRAVVAEFLRNMPTKKCHNCGAPSVGLRKDGYTKFFKSRMTSTAARAMKALGLSYTSALEIAEGGVHAAEDDDVADSSDDEDVWAGNESKQKAAAERDEGAGGRAGKSQDKAPAVEDTSSHSFLTPAEVEGQLKLLWKRERKTVRLIWGPAVLPRRLKSPEGWKVFFLRALPVAPARFRPPTRLGDMTFEHPQNYYLSKVLNLNAQLATLSAPTDAAEGVDLSKAMSVWIDLQESVNSLFDSTKSTQTNDAQSGIRQLLEKKEGLFRQNMMGKRVNYAARSVISPDPFIQPNQIGVPVAFAKQLTYPQPVTDWNVDKLRRAVINGPNVYPGANYVQDERGRLVDLSKRDRNQREAISKTLLTPAGAAGAAAASGAATGKKVWRHLENNDVVLMNRQPTLHRPSIMAHRARVLRFSTQKTIRMHYANCNTYNADFDGDEMNMHFPQDELARAEAYELVATPYQYCVPTSGKPLRGLIQDHVDMGVRLCSRDTLLTRDQYQQLVFAAVSSLPAFEADAAARIPTVPPAILLPKRRWTGKQVITTLLKAMVAHLPEKAQRFSMEGKTKVNAAAWGIPKSDTSMPDEHRVTIRHGEMLTGVLDKAHLGASDYGLIHCVYELYGPEYASALLSSLGRLLTVFLQQSAVTCAVDDLMLSDEAEAERRALLESARHAGVNVAAKFAGEEEVEDVNEALRPERVKAVRTALQQKLTGGEACAEGAAAVLAARLDDAFKGALSSLHSSVINACLPNGQVKSFPRNNLSLIIFSGAKGSLVNHAMISCGLGQQELEGRRVPVMVSGKSLPSFVPYDPNPRAGGYIGDRFLTGLRPQEYFFHCMSGREGLVDTAVKTSRSGYLQRCIMKHLEDLHVHYDYSVRDSDGNLVQFLYGDDGMDVTNTKFLQGTDSTFGFIAQNHHAFEHKYRLDDGFLERNGLDGTTAGKLHAQVQAAKAAMDVADAETTKTDSSAVNLAALSLGKAADVVVRRRLNPAASWTSANVGSTWRPARVTRVHGGEDGTSITDVTLDVVYSSGEAERGVPVWVQGVGVTARARLPDPVNCQVSVCNNVGAVSEKMQSQLTSFADRDPAKLLRDDADDDDDVLNKERFQMLMWVKYLRSIVAPGEPVGTLAAQSVGEPSTQMTLNTFHLAGHGGVNVTLGIPRLREIIMTASQHIKTPAMTLPLKSNMSKLHARLVARKLDTLRLSDLIAWHRSQGGIRVAEQFSPQGGSGPMAMDTGLWDRVYRIRIFLADQGAIQRTFQLSFRRVSAAVGRRFTACLLATIAADVRRSGGVRHARAVAGTDGKDAAEAGGKGNTVGASFSRAKASRRKPSKQPAPKLSTPAAGDSDDSDVGSDSDVEEVAGASASHKKKTRSYGTMDEADRQAAENEDEDDEDGAAKAKQEQKGEEGVESDVDMSGSDDESTGKAVMGVKGLAPGVSAVVVPSSVSANPRFGGCYANESEGWVEVTLRFPASFQKLLMLDAAERAADKTLVRATKGISRALVMKQRINGRMQLCVQTEGVNLSAAAAMAESIDINNIDTNDIGAVLHHFGVEAARAAIVKEIKTVFGVYGISVDARHLGLIADYMTQSGGYRPFNRIGVNALASPLLKMSFETTTKFLTAACLHGETDAITSPSARIVMGRNVGYGTGCFDIRQPIAL